MYKEIKELKELLDLGAITQEEFDKKKTEILNLSPKLSSEEKADLSLIENSSSVDAFRENPAPQASSSEDNAKNKSTETDKTIEPKQPITHSASGAEPHLEKGNESLKANAEDLTPLKEASGKSCFGDISDKKKKVSIKVILTILLVILRDSLFRVHLSWMHLFYCRRNIVRRH